MAITLAELNVIIGADPSGFRKQMTALQRSLVDLGQHMDRVGKKLTLGLTVPLTALGATSVSAAGQLDSLTRGLASVAGSSEEAEKQLSSLQEIAKLPGLGFREAIEGSTRLQAAGFSASLAEEALRGFGNALATVGAGKAELDQVTRALSQIASKGKISAEEINQLAEVVPQIRVVMQEAFGTSNAELLQKAGISAEEFVTKVTEALNKLPQVTGGVQNAFENLSDATFRARAAIGEQLLPVVIPLVDGLTEMLTGLRDVNPEVVRWGIAFAAVAAAVGPLLVGIGALTPAVIGLAAATGSTLLTVIAVGGPLVIALTALSALFLKNKLDALAARGAIEQYTQSLSSLTREQAQMEKRDLQRARAALETELASKQASLADLAGDPIRLRQATERIAEIKDTLLPQLNQQYRVLTQRVTELDTASSGLAETGNTVVMTTNAVTTAIDGETEALKRATTAAEGFNKAREEQARLKRLLEKPDVGIATLGVDPALAGPIVPGAPTPGGGGILGTLTESLGGLVASLNPVTLGMGLLSSALGGLVSRGISFLTRGLSSAFSRIFGLGGSSEKIVRSGNTLAQTFEKINASAGNLPEIVDLITRRRVLLPATLPPSGTPPLTPPTSGGGPTQGPGLGPLEINIINPPAGMDIVATANQVANVFINQLRMGGYSELATALRRGG